MKPTPEEEALALEQGEQLLLTLMKEEGIPQLPPAPAGIKVATSKKATNEPLPLICINCSCQWEVRIKNKKDLEKVCCPRCKEQRYKIRE